MLESTTQVGNHLKKINQKGFGKKRINFILCLRPKILKTARILMKGIKLKSFKKIKLIIFQMWMLVIFSRLQTCLFPKASNFLSPFLPHLGSHIYPSLPGIMVFSPPLPSFLLAMPIQDWFHVGKLWIWKEPWTSKSFMYLTSLKPGPEEVTYIRSCTVLISLSYFF